MPRYFKSTANKPGGGVRKGYRRGGRNLRDEEARVIGVQDNAADELRRVRARRPHDAAERRDRRDQLARVGSRERNARDEMARLRGYQYGGAIGRQAAAMGPSIAARANNPDYRSLRHYLGSRRGYQAGGEIVPDMSAVDRQLATLEGEMAQLQQTDPRLEAAKRSHEWSQTPEGAAFEEYMNRIHRAGAARNTQPTAPMVGRGNLRRGPDAYNYGNLPPRGSQYGGRVGFKTGGRIPRKKKGAKFI